MVDQPVPAPLCSTGIAGLDEILHGGLPPHRQYLLEGMPGTGKTTLSMQFLLEGRRLGETCLYITLSETKQELHDVARSHGWTLEGIELYELVPAESRLETADEYTVFRPEEVELGETVQEVCDLVERVQPSRAVFDSLSELRLIARDPLRYRRQILGLKQFFAGRRCTVLLLDDKNVANADLQLQSISHGVLSLEHRDPDYGMSRRRLNVVKLRGVKFRSGYHDYIIDTGGFCVFPRLVAAEHRTPHRTEALKSGMAALDTLLGGGLNTGTSTLIMGPAGCGKSTIAGVYMHAAVQQGKRVATYLFEETVQTYLNRMEGIGYSLGENRNAGHAIIQQVDPAELSPGEFIHRIRHEVEKNGTRVIVIDSLNGYLNAMPNERFLLVQLHELLSYLAEKEVITILVLAQHGIISHMQAPVEVSYLADAVILLRFFEFQGALRKAISALKHRISAHEETIRELVISRSGVRVGEVLAQFQGIMTGTPVFTGEEGALFKRTNDAI